MRDFTNTRSPSLRHRWLTFGAAALLMCAAATGGLAADADQRSAPEAATFGDEIAGRAAVRAESQMVAAANPHAAAAGLAVDEVRATLGLLDLDGWVRERPTGWLKAAANRREAARAD